MSDGPDVFGVRVTAMKGLARLAPALEAFDFIQAGDPQAREDGPIGCDPLSLASWLMTVTKGVGLIATVPVSWAPFHVARALASFDLLSHGRCGWMPVDGGLAVEPERLAEHVDVVRQLFDSWDDDALVLDKETSLFARRDGVRRIRHEGAYYTVDGPLNAPRPPQGAPVMLASPDQDLLDADFVLARAGDPAPLHQASGRLLMEMPADLAAGLGAVEVLLKRLGDLPDGVRGVVFVPADPDVDIPVLAAEVLPKLRTGPAPVGGDLRARLGLERPANRYAGAVQ